MINVERLQKLNQLAGDLLEHGFAADREDALRQADNTLKREVHSVSIMRMNDTPPMGRSEEPAQRDAQKLQASYAAQEAPEQIPVQEIPAPASTQSFEQDWNMLFRNLNKKIDDQNSAIGALREQIGALHHGIAALKNAPPKVVMQTPAPQQVAAPIAAAPPAPAAYAAAPAAPAIATMIDATTGKTIHVPIDKQATTRTGGYKPEDVSVEKMFYSGTRPKT